MSDDKILDLGKLPKELGPNLPDSHIAAMEISVAMNGGYSLTISFEDNRWPMTMIFPSKIELMILLNSIIVR